MEVVPTYNVDGPLVSIDTNLFIVQYDNPNDKNNIFTCHKCMNFRCIVGS